jgi:hypothetical protein
LIGQTTARLILGASLLPFLWFAGRDQVLHFSARRVPIAETILHFILGAILFVVIGRSFLFDVRFVTIGILVIAAAGSIDEFVFHRGVPEPESDVHAKEHFALFVFIAVFEVLALVRPT